MGQLSTLKAKYNIITILCIIIIWEMWTYTCTTYIHTVIVHSYIIL